MIELEENGEEMPTTASAPAVEDPSKSLDGRIIFEMKHHRSAKKIQQCARAYVAFTKLYARANLLVEKIIEPVQTKQYGRPIYYYYHTVLQRSRWDKPTYLGSLDIVKTAPTYAIEQAAIASRRLASAARLEACHVSHEFGLVENGGPQHRC